MRLVPARTELGIAAGALVTLALGATVAVFVAGPAAASGPATTTTAATVPGPLPGADPNSPAAKYFVINGTVNAASDHEILGSSAFPNYATGAVDNYYSLAHSHVDNSPFAEGTASPADTGPVGQTAAAGNVQQPQYADARWPGDTGKATYGTRGQPYATAEADAYTATAAASEASSGLTGTGGTGQIAVPKGFDARLRQALAAWKAKWQGRLHPTARPPAATVGTPAVTVPTPVATVTTPTATVATPTATLGGPTPTVGVPLPAAPPSPAPGTATPSRSLSAASSGDGASLLESTTLAAVDPKTGALVTRGESSLGRVSLGGGQIVIEGIHVSASITNDGTTPTDKTAVSVGSASVGGVPVTIDQDGVHLAGQSQALPYQQASDALNGALKQAGIQLFLVAPQVTTDSCGGTGTTTGSGGDAGSCGSSGMTTSSCGGTDTTPGTTTDATTTPTLLGSTGTTTTTTTTTSTTDSCGAPGTTPTTTTDSCGAPGTTTGTTTDTTTTTTTTDAGGFAGTPTGSSSSGEETVSATGVHLVFTQPVDQSGVPAQYAEHILGEVYVNSLAVPAGGLPPLGLDNLTTAGNPCGVKHTSAKRTSGHTPSTGGGSSAGGATSGSGTSSASMQPASSATGSTSQPFSGSTGGAAPPASSPTGGSPPAQLVSALRKPLWLLVAYLLWQALVIASGVSLWSWHRGEAGAP